MGKYQISPTFINQLQISLRKESGLPSLNPSDDLPPSSSIFQDAISAVGSDAQGLRCGDCNGELLRGSQSIFCIYCARFLHNSAPISFTSTLGCRWFLRFLSLDGSETVERSSDCDTESGTGQNSTKDEIPLSELLDLQLQWPGESIKFDMGNEHGKRWLKLVGLDLDELLQTGESLEHSSSNSNKQEVASESSKTEDVATFSGQSNLSLFENEKRSGEGVEDEESEWAAEFQSADEDVKADHGSHLSLKQGNFGNNNFDNISFTHIPAFSNVEPKSGQPVNPNQSEGSILVEDAAKGVVPVNDSSFDWLPAADQQSVGIMGDPSQVEKSDFDDWDEFKMFTASGVPGAKNSGELDASDSWNDFTGSVGAEHTQLDKNLDWLKPGHSGGTDDDFWGQPVKQDVSLESSQNVSSNQTDSLGRWSGSSKEVDNSYDMWNDFKSSVLKHDNQQQLVTTEAVGNKWAAEGDGIFKLQHNFDGLSIGNKEQLPGNSEAIAEKTNDSHGELFELRKGDSLDLWSDFGRLDGVSDGKPIIDDPFSGAWTNVSGLMATHVNQPQSSNTLSTENQTFVEDDSAFGSWSDFRTSQTQVENDLSGNNLVGSISDEILPGKDSVNLASAEDKNMQNSWGDFVLSTPSLEQQSEVGVTMSFENNLISEDLFGFHMGGKESICSPDNQFTSNGGAFRGDEFASVNDEAIDEWTDFASSSSVQASSCLSSNANTDFNQQAVEHDPLDAWNFIGRPSDKPAVKNNALAKGNIPESDLLGSGNSQFVGSNSSSHPDQFPETLNDHNRQIQPAVSHTEALNLVRVETSVEADDFAQRSGSERVVDETPDLISSVAENLISEMHDLSFMLESSLSVPKSGT